MVEHPPLLLRPHYVEKPWGGRRLAEALGRTDLPDGAIGESWDVADVGGVVSVVEGGPHDGRSLREVVGRPFPILVKVLDAQQDLSVQLHPDDAYGDDAKEEAWIALASGGSVATGTAGEGPTPSAWLDHLDRHPLEGPEDTTRAPTMIHVPPGTVHAILAGSLVWEVQSPSDVTWRLDDYGRRGPDGRLRDLHLEEAAPLLARGPEVGAVRSCNGCRIDGRRITLEMRGPGTHTVDDALVVMCPEGGSLHGPWADAPFEVPAGRTVVLPTGPWTLESAGWSLYGGVPEPAETP